MAAPSSELAARLAKAQARADMVDPREGRATGPSTPAHDTVTAATAAAAHASLAISPPLPMLTAPVTLRGGAASIKQGFHTNTAIGLSFQVEFPYDAAATAPTAPVGAVKYTLPVLRVQMYTPAWLSFFSLLQSWQPAQALPGSIRQWLTLPAGGGGGTTSPTKPAGRRQSRLSAGPAPTYLWLPEQVDALRYGLNENEFIVATWQKSTPKPAPAPGAVAAPAPGRRASSGGSPMAVVNINYTVAGLSPSTRYRFQLVPGLLTITGTPVTVKPGRKASPLPSTSVGMGDDGVKLTYSVVWGVGTGETVEFSTLSDAEEKKRQSEATAAAAAVEKRAKEEIERIVKLHKAKLGEGEYTADVFRLRVAEREAAARASGAVPQPSAGTSAAYVKKPAAKSPAVGATSPPAKSAAGGSGTDVADLKARLVETQRELEAAAADAAAARAAEAEALQRAAAAQAAAQAAAVATIVPAPPTADDLAALAAEAAADAATSGGAGDAPPPRRHHTRVVSFLTAPAPEVTDEVARTVAAVNAASETADAADIRRDHLESALEELKEKLVEAGEDPATLMSPGGSSGAGTPGINLADSAMMMAGQVFSFFGGKLEGAPATTSGST